MYPLRFEPVFRRYLWGGRKLAEVLAKPIGQGIAAESWEIVDHGEDQSVVRFGDLAGKSLRQLIANWGTSLLGDSLNNRISSPNIPPHLKNRFPLLLKFLDASRPLSVQVHPNDEIGRKLSPPDFGKTEAWYVLQADPGARIFAGLKQGVTLESFRQAIENNKTETVLHSFEAKQGDCVFIEAGTIHAIGAGLLIAEIQQASDTTFRIYDWGRVDTNGQPRSLHIEQALMATNFDQGPVFPQPIDPIANSNWHSLVSCDKFAMNRGSWDRKFETGGDGKLRIMALAAGSVSIAGDPGSMPLAVGETVLFPACLGSTTLTPGPDGAEILEFLVPDPV